MYKNHEGYADPVAGQAIRNIMREYKKEQKKKWAQHHEAKNRTKLTRCITMEGH